MGRKRYQPEQIISILRVAVVLLAKTVGQWPGVYGSSRPKRVPPAGSADPVNRAGESLGKRL